MVEKAKEIAKRPAVRQKHFWQFLILVAFILVANVASDLAYQRFDLTKEKRFTLSEATKDLITKLDEPIYVNVYLDGEFPQEYRRLKNATRDMLNEFQHVSNGKLEYRFEDVLTDQSLKDKNDILTQLTKKGLKITQPEIGQDEATAEKFIIPGAMISYKGKEYPLNLLKRELGQALEQDINGSIELLEYEIGNVIRKCVVNKEIRIGFTQGHGELDATDVADISKSLDEFYSIDGVNINLTDTLCTKQFLSEMQRNPEESGKILLDGVMRKMNAFDALIIAKPRLNFLDEELFLIDQYVMNGGKIIWLVEPLIAEMDSVAKYGSVMTANYNLNVSDLLFRYSVRVNQDLIQDKNCNIIPVLAQGGSGQPGYVPWLFYPLFTTNNQHPIGRNVPEVWGRYAASIDTLPNKKLRKTMLLTSSEVSRVANNPVNISFDLLRLKPTDAMFQRPNNMAAVLLEGEFKSMFAHRRAMKQKSPIPLKESVSDNAMIVISDGDLIRNETNKDRTQISPLGYDKYATRAAQKPIEFANKKFFLNCVDYLCDESNLIEVRSKKIQLRLLNKAKVKTEKRKWQMINMVLPIVLLVLFGLINYWIRRRKYT